LSEYQKRRILTMNRYQYIVVMFLAIALVAAAHAEEKWEQVVR
jgi:hypothetical protein